MNLPEPGTIATAPDDQPPPVVWRELWAALAWAEPEMTADELETELIAWAERIRRKGRLSDHNK